MIRRTPRLDAFEEAQLREPGGGYQRNLQIFESLLAEARLLGKIPPSNPLEGVENDVALARKLHGLRASG